MIIISIIYNRKAKLVQIAGSGEKSILISFPEKADLMSPEKV
jgi:hypothetical protein